MLYESFIPHKTRSNYKRGKKHVKIDERLSKVFEVKCRLPQLPFEVKSRLLLKTVIRRGSWVIMLVASCGFSLLLDKRCL